MKYIIPKRIDKPGVYDLTADEYHADPCVEPSLSNSIAKVLVMQTPLHAWTAHPRLNPGFEREEHSKFDIGNACHALILRDERAFKIVRAENWTTQSAQESRSIARIAGQIPLLTHQWISVECMARAARIQLDRHAEARDAFTNGKPEQTLIWREGCVWCRARLDWLPNAGRFFDDYKSTKIAHPDDWARNLFKLGFDMQAAFYSRGIKALGLCNDPVFRFIVQEVEMPHALSVVALMPGALDLAEHKVARALDIWQRCIQSDHWPAYPTRTCYVDVPPWAEAQFTARDAAAYDAQRDAEIVDQLHRPLETT